ncbi:hypothetical protein TcasGA2_TC033367 [Tribolium castaneum]|uniref:Uncharacterized protein n=1 Tax=Tribolium castaneum TaxID=7070 RepID=A0A139WGB0_TRICA|nr:hypothetical protein TcasGA2_TC033367 [Tribolium castaneum]
MGTNRIVFLVVIQPTVDEILEIFGQNVLNIFEISDEFWRLIESYIFFTSTPIVSLRFKGLLKLPHGILGVREGTPRRLQ